MDINISVIYITYRRANDLVKSIDSVIKQHYYNYEIIIINQESDEQIITKYNEKYSHNERIKLYNLKNNVGVAEGRNIGAKYAKGKILVFLDDDAEFINLYSLSTIESIFSKNKNINIMAFNIIGNPEKINKFKFNAIKKKDKFTNQYIGCGHAIRNEIFKKLEGYTRELFFWGEEIEFAIKSFKLKDNLILYKNDIVVLHRVSPINRFKWNDIRLYYKVRNRLAIIYNLYPKGINVITILYYLFIYFIRAIQNKAIKQYFTGLKDFKSIKVDKKYRLNLYQFLRYKLIIK